MARLRSVRAVRVLTFEEKTRVANLFMLLIEVNLEKRVTRKRRAPQSTKNKRTQRTPRKTKHKPTSCPMKHYCNTCPALKTARRDLFLQSFTRILKGDIINIIMGYCNDRYDRFTTYARFI
jgi:hypothetical protein